LKTSFNRFQSFQPFNLKTEMNDFLRQNEQNSKTEFPSLFTWTSESVFEPEVEGSEEVNAYHLSFIIYHYSNGWIIQSHGSSRG